MIDVSPRRPGPAVALALLLHACAPPCERALSREHQAWCEASVLRCPELNARGYDTVADCITALNDAFLPLCEDYHAEGCVVDRAASRACIRSYQSLEEDCSSAWEPPDACFAVFVPGRDAALDEVCNAGPDSVLD